AAGEAGRLAGRGQSRRHWRRCAWLGLAYQVAAAVGSIRGQTPGGGRVTAYAHENTYDALFWTAAQAEAQRTAAVGVDAATLFALAKGPAAIESGFDPTAYHFDGPDLILNVSRGILQIEGVTARAMGLPIGNDTDTYTGSTAPRYNVPTRTSGMYDVNLAIPAGVHIMADNVVATGGNLAQAIAAYNEGLPHALRDSYPFDNQAYVDAVTSKMGYFQAQGVPPTALSPEAGSSGDGPAAVAVLLPLLLVGGLAYLVLRK